MKRPVSSWNELDLFFCLFSDSIRIMWHQSTCIIIWHHGIQYSIALYANAVWLGVAWDGVAWRNAPFTLLYISDDMDISLASFGACCVWDGLLFVFSSSSIDFHTTLYFLSFTTYCCSLLVLVPIICFIWILWVWVVSNFYFYFSCPNFWKRSTKSAINRSGGCLSVWRFDVYYELNAVHDVTNETKSRNEMKQLERNEAAS